MRKRACLLFCLVCISFIFLSNAGICNESAQVSVVKSSTSPQQISQVIYQLGSSQGKEINAEAISREIGSIPEGPLYEPYVNKVLSAAREEGLFLNAFKLSADLNTLGLLKSQGEPFIAYLKDEGYCLVNEILDRPPQGYFIRYTSREGKSQLADSDDFINKWNGHVLSFPLVNILAERILSDKPRNSRFIVTYSYHKEDFEKLKKILDKLRDEATSSGKMLIYIDELGLIPQESVKRTKDSSKVSEKDAFERAKKSLSDEVAGFERGVSIYDENPFYQAQYSYLAKYKIKSYMEDLDYENWKQIVAFDNLNIHNEAIKAFCLGEPDLYLKKSMEYAKGFWLHNVKERDELFRKQIEKIAQEYPDSIIFSLRGIGHYGMEEKLQLADFTVETLVIAEGSFNENLISDQMNQVMLSNGVNIEADNEKLLYLRSFPEDCLRTYFQKTISDLALATRLAKSVVDRMNEQEIKRLSRDISYAFAKGTISNTEGVWDYVYNWAKDRGKITSQETPETAGTPTAGTVSQ